MSPSVFPRLEVRILVAGRCIGVASAAGLCSSVVGMVVLELQRPENVLRGGQAAAAGQGQNGMGLGRYGSLVALFLNVVTLCST
jgi:hypothetical protein